MKPLYVFLIISINCIYSLEAQLKPNITFNLLIFEENTDKPIQSLIKWHSLNTNDDFVFKSDNTGKAIITVPFNQNYEVTIPNSLAIFTVELSEKSNSKKDLILKFEIEKEVIIPQSASKSQIIKKNQAHVTKVIYENLIGLKFFNKPSKSDIVEIIDIEENKTVKSTTNDTTTFTLPTEKRYKLAIKGVKIKNDTIFCKTPSPVMIPYILNFTSDNTAVVFPLSNNILLSLTYINLSGNPVQGDTVTIINQKTQKQYKGVTNKHGNILFVLPKEEDFSISLTNFQNISTIYTKNSPSQDIITYDYIINYPSNADILKRKLELKTSLEKRDSLYKIYGKIGELDIKQFNNDILANKDSLKRNLEIDPNFFKKVRMTIGAVLYRMRDKWVNKVIVTDITGSMYPYMRDLALWHSLEFMKNEKNAYIFFNDGDNKRDNQKQIGNTGGIYTTLSSANDTIIRVMYNAMDKGDGGDGPENDIEAILEGQKYLKPKTEMILIADSYSPIKDISLVDKITVPVRIVLCGTEGFGTIHPDYLWLAYKTKGSLHTVEEDITNMSELVEGKILTINGKKFKLLNNTFFEIKN